MPESIEARKRQRKRSAVRGVALFALFQGVGAAFWGALACLPGNPGWAKALLLALAGLSLLLILPAVLVLKERFREIEGGELDAAAEY